MKNISQKIFITTTLLLLCLQVSSVSAEEKRPAEEAVKAAHELLEMMDMPNLYAQTVKATVDAQTTQNPEMAAYEDIFTEFFTKYMGWDNMKDDIAKIYATNFSAQEIQEMIAFYKTPVGQKTIKLLPKLSREGVVLGQKKLMENQAELKQMIEERAAELESQE